MPESPDTRACLGHAAFIPRQAAACLGHPAALLSQLEKFELGAELHNAVLKEMANELEIEIEPEIHQATLNVMSEVLDLPSEVCQFSALHGLGHWHAHHPEQVEQIVDAFVTRHKDLRPHLIEYASRARQGQM